MRVTGKSRRGRYRSLTSISSTYKQKIGIGVQGEFEAEHYSGRPLHLGLKVNSLHGNVTGRVR